MILQQVQLNFLLILDYHKNFIVSPCNFQFNNG